MHVTLRLFLLVCALLHFTPGSRAQETQPREPQATPVVELVGRVVTWDGQPLAGAALRCEPMRNHLTADLLREPQAVTDAAGRFRLRATPPPPNTDQPLVLFVGMKGMAAVTRSIAWKRKNQATNEPELWLPPELDADDGDDGEEEDAPPKPANETPPEYEAETDMGDIVLAPAGRLTGRVRDSDGKPLAGVLVAARDQLEQGSTLQSGSRLQFYTAARTDASGIFMLPNALPQGASLSFQLDGYLRELRQPVSIASGVEVAMRPGGLIQGRVLDAEGRFVAGATVSVAYELASSSSSGTTSVRSEADGSFRLNLEYPGRWRARAYKADGKRTQEARSEVFVGPKELLELTFKPPKEQEEQRILTIKVVAKASGKPIQAFRAATVWEDYANRNNNYLDYRLRSALRSSPLHRRGQAELAGPSQHGSLVGAVRVLAAGYAPMTVKQIEWKEATAEQPQEPLQIELESEASVSGRLIDESTGAPVVGAKVYARMRQDANQGSYEDGNMPPRDAVTSAEDGSYRIGGLGEGAWEIVVIDPKRPRAPAKEFELTPQQQLTELTISLPSGATVAGKLVGTKIGQGTRVFLSRLPKQTFGESSGYYSSYYGSQQPPKENHEVQPDGSFSIDGVALENHLLVVRMPSPPRMGGDLYLPLEPFRVRRGGVQREFDCSEDQPGLLRGRVSFAHTDVPFDRLVVVARLVGDEGRQFFSPFDNRHPGPRSFVGPGGEYEIRLGPGNYQLVVVDLATSMTLHQEAKKVELTTGTTVERDLQLELARIELELKPAADVKKPAQVARIEVRVMTKAMKDAGMNIGGNDNYDSGVGVPLPFGQDKLELILPLGDATFLCRNAVSGLRVDNERWNLPPLGRAEMEVTVGQGAKTSCTIELGEEPEIPDPDKKDKQAEAGEESADGGK